MDILDPLTAQALDLLTSTRRDARTPAVRLARSLHPTPPLYPGGVRSQLDDVPHVLPALARHAQAGDRHALLLAAVFMRDQLRATTRAAARALTADADDLLSETLAATFDLLRAAAEPDVLTPRLIAAQTSKRLYTHFSGTDTAIPCDPLAPVFEQLPTASQSDTRPTEQLLENARAQRVITALEHHTLTVLYLSTNSPATAAQVLDASTSAVERRAQRAIRKLASYATATGPRVVAA